MRISELAKRSTRKAIHIAPGDVLAFLTENLLRLHANTALVLDEGVPVGVLSERDALLAWARGLSPLTPVRDLMHTPVTCVCGDSDWREAYNQLSEQSASHLIVTDGMAQNPVALSERDLCRLLGASLLSPLQKLGAFVRPDIPTVSPATTLAETARILSDEQNDCVIVVDQEHPLGLLSPDDLMRLQFRHPDPEKTTVAEISIPPIQSIPIHTSLPDAFRAMLSFGVSHLVVTDDDGRMVGIIGASEIETLLEAKHIRDLHARMSADAAALSESEARRKAILDSTQVFLGLLDNNGVVLEANAAALQIIDAKPEQVIGQPLEQTPWWSHDPAQRSRLKTALLRCQAGLSDTFEATHLKNDGTIVHVEFHLRPVCHAAGKPHYLLAEGRDITSRKEAEQALFASKQHFEALLKATPVGVIESNAEGECIFVNPTYEAIAGRTFEEVRGMGWFDSIHPDDRSNMLDGMEKNMKGHPCRLEYRRIHRNGSVRWILGQNAPLFSQSGEVTGAISTLIDITEQKEREGLLRVMSEALKQSNKAIALVDGENRFRYTNSAFCNLFGYRPDEIIGQSTEILADGNARSKLSPKQVHERVCLHKFCKGEALRRAKCGKLIPVLLDSAQVTTSEGEPLWHINTYTDLTEIREQLEILDRMAHHDALTNLPNRVLLSKRLELELAHARRNRKLVALLFIDLDNFKYVNDTLGHHAGDLLLQEVALRLKKCVRESDTVARLSGDEFAILLPNLSSRKSAENIARKIIAIFEPPFFLEGRNIESSASIGISLYPVHAGDETRLLMSSDAAMYAAKSQGRGSFAFAGE
ncbi:PAS domain S-box-containing protein/diguanylate cyclase (GGDEF) domain-containing protein [Formivibrio citricus]|uniref:PAS domain S-box-containing protein/diguanylate cyclase (GGDEF) domain-containing protein n=1 Tax=Formivibrio citricus TaxID=83765 RepID=A0A1I5A551_9NEIS|nr:PAS domain S-box protein [Formivibrio citricus]SFN57547.1 PAS domain S-box-containing protein/diguanylate cyclase (GGDEF) domain-containing protein [Formivibrio citricus]